MNDFFYNFKWYPRPQFKSLVTFLKVASKTIFLITLTVTVYSFYLSGTGDHSS